MIVGHLGPALGTGQGGPAGYLAQLACAVGAAGTAPAHAMLFPPGETGAPAAGAASRPSGALFTALRRLRRTWMGSPRVFRPADADLRRLGGAADAQLRDVWSGVQAAAEPSLRQALDARVDILFAHDAPTAEAALACRHPSQQVWLLAHNPMPLALYLVWCWGVPERRWEEVAALPDVQAWVGREVDVIRRVDRVIVPSPEAAAELVRADAGMSEPLARAEYLMTGASGPPRQHPGLSVAELRARWSLPTDVPVALFVGNAQPYRGLDLLLDALHYLPVDRLPGVLAVAGCQADRLPFHPRLVALGHVREVADLLAAVDFVVNVNRFSLFDLSTIEALEAGRPMLIGPTGGNLTFRDLGAGCVMLDRLTPSVIASGLTRLFRLPDDERLTLGRLSARCYEAHLTPRHLLERHLALYDTAAALPQA